VTRQRCSVALAPKLSGTKATSLSSPEVEEIFLPRLAKSYFFIVMLLLSDNKEDM